MRLFDLRQGFILSLVLAGAALNPACGSGSTRRANLDPARGGAGGGTAGTGAAGGEEPGGAPGRGGTSGNGATGGSGGSGGVPPGGGVGDECSTRTPCRAGLVCEASVCEPGGSLEPGSPCVIGPECAPGNTCRNGTCGPAGDGTNGDGCITDADCAEGLRCLVTGLSPTCVPQGTGDVGDPCSGTVECYQGLACVDGACGRPGPTIWRGVECDPPVDDGEEVRAYFEVPGADGAEEGDFFRLPFPNDARATGRRLDLSGFPTPGVGLLGVDAVKLYVDAIEANDSAWGAFQTVYFRFSGQLDIESLRQMGSVSFIDVTPGAPELGQNRGLSWYYSVGRRNYICENWMGIRRPTGEPLLPGHTYAAWLTTQVLAEGGGTIRRSPNLIALLDDAAPDDPALEPIHDLYAPFRDYLAAQNRDPSTILTAAVFTVADQPATMQRIADAVADLDPPTATDWVACDTDVESPCPDAEGDRACGAPTADYQEYHALVSLPIFQDGTPPYLTPADGGGIAIIADPPRQDVCLSLTVPTGTAPAAGWPLVVTAHGTGGSFRSHVRDEVAGALARNAVPFAVLGIDQVVHGPRRLDSTESPENLFFNFLNPDAARGNPLQGAADQLSLVRFAATIDGTGDMPTTIDPDRIVFFGHSQGGTEGSLMLPFADDYKAAALSGNGGSLMHALLNKTNPVNIKALLPLLIQEPALVDGTEDVHPVLSLLQQWIDPADPLNFARLLRTPPTGHAMKSTFQIQGLFDTYSPAKTLWNYSIAGGFTQVEPVLDDELEFEDILLPHAAPPVAGNLGMMMITHGMRQYEPADGDDGHFVVFDVPQANEDLVRFLSMAAAGQVPAIGD